MPAPLIGITGRRLRFGAIREASPTYADETVTVFFAAFADAVARAGGLPVFVPFEAAATDVVARLDGLVVTGGADIDQARWGGPRTDVGDPLENPAATDPVRDDYEEALLQAALGTEVPLLGVCRGHQLLNVALGGTLVPHLAADPIDHVSHRPPSNADDHNLATETGSLARRLLGERPSVNSYHHQAVERLGTGLVVGARADDGVVEALELPGRPVLGVQWHPEWHPGPSPDPTFTWLVDTARTSR